jgi:Carboxypeptidase regulatory-like domain
MRATWTLLTILVAAVPAAAQTAGSISGTITAAPKRLASIRVTIDPAVCGKELPDEAILVDAKGGLANAVVTLTGVKAANPAEGTVSNDGCRFVPRVQVVRPNANLHASSEDPVLHTTQALTSTGQTLFNLAIPVPGINLARPIGGAGVVHIACNIHQWMRGWVIVTDEAAAVTGLDGTFALPNVPPGTYELKVWHESLAAAPQKVTVVAGKPTPFTVQMK